jgi:hypothetical protein
MNSYVNILFSESNPIRILLCTYPTYNSYTNCNLHYNPTNQPTKSRPFNPQNLDKKERTDDELILIIIRIHALIFFMSM